MGLACLIAVFEFIWKSRKLATDENVRHSKLIAKALSHTNENMFHVPKEKVRVPTAAEAEVPCDDNNAYFDRDLRDEMIVTHATSLALAFVAPNHQTTEERQFRFPVHVESDTCLKRAYPVLQ